MSQDLDKARLLQSLGYASPHDAIEEALAAAGLSKPEKRRILRAKVPAVEALLEGLFLRVCQRGDCQARVLEGVAGGRRPVVASAAEHCDLCGGSVTRRVLDDLVTACRGVGWGRLCVVGGSPSARTRLQDEVAGRLELRLVDGTVARTRQQAVNDLAWADHLVVWGGTQLDHKVSLLYTGSRRCSTVHRRGIEDLARHLANQARLKARKE